MRRTAKLSFLVVILVTAIALVNPIPARAALTVLSVSPSTVVNDTATTITITGTEFEVGAVVLLNGSALATTFLNSGTLTAVVPAGILPGTYDVTVKISDILSATCTGCLTVTAPVPTSTPTPTFTPVPFGRPQVVIDIYTVSVSAIRYGQEFNLNVSLDNAGGSTAYGIQVTFTSADLLMLKNGGVTAVGSLGIVGKADISQTMTASASLAGRSMVSVEMNISYYDEKGAAYTEKFTINIPVAASGAYSATATPTAIRRSQLVITHSETDVVPLQPGAQFKLSLMVQNVGSLPAKGVTMIIGGGSASGGKGTPQAGVSGGSGEFTNFAPLGTSNIKSLGDIAAGASLETSQQLIVNVSTNPGVYPMKITFSYTDSQGNVINDEQVITLLVYNLPQVEIGFYQPAGPFFVGQPGLLPLQVVNLGRKTAVLGNLRVETTGGMLENGEMLVGVLDAGGYFPLDVTFHPEASGSVDLLITIEYSDDFSQPRSITKSLTVQVEESTEPSIPGGSEIIPVTEETFWQKLWRFILGLLGLDSGSSSDGAPVPAGTLEPAPLEPRGGGGEG
ncbi:MAG: IPT/TIG domain-containing protein [Anaerolineales bacterium]|nr:IPT/TIG domain-containing protein [Anaerolineales bacterium]